jgi:hypothetical protein
MRTMFEQYCGHASPRGAATASHAKSAGFAVLTCLRSSPGGPGISCRALLHPRTIRRSCSIRSSSSSSCTHPIHSESDRHHHLANIAYGGPDRKTVYITDSLSGDILTARLPVAGKLLYGLQ